LTTLQEPVKPDKIGSGRMMKKVYKYPQDIVHDGVIAVFNHLGIELVQDRIDKGRIDGKTGPSLRSWGVGLTVLLAVEKAERETSYQIRAGALTQFLNNPNVTDPSLVEAQLQPITDRIFYNGNGPFLSKDGVTMIGG